MRDLICEEVEKRLEEVANRLELRSRVADVGVLHGDRRRRTRPRRSWRMGNGYATEACACVPVRHQRREGTDRCTVCAALAQRVVSQYTPRSRVGTWCLVDK